MKKLRVTSLVGAAQDESLTALRQGRRPSAAAASVAGSDVASSLAWLSDREPNLSPTVMGLSDCHALKAEEEGGATIEASDAPAVTPSPPQLAPSSSSSSVVAACAAASSIHSHRRPRPLCLGRAIHAQRALRSAAKDRSFARGAPKAAAEFTHSVWLSDGLDFEAIIASSGPLMPPLPGSFRLRSVHRSLQLSRSFLSVHCSSSVSSRSSLPDLSLPFSLWFRRFGLQSWIG